MPQNSVAMMPLSCRNSASCDTNPHHTRARTAQGSERGETSASGDSSRRRRGGQAAPADFVVTRGDPREARRVIANARRAVNRTRRGRARRRRRLSRRVEGSERGVVLYCVVLCCAVLCCVVLCCTVLCCVVLCCDLMCCVVLCCVVLCCGVVFCGVVCCVCCAALCCVVLCCVVLCCVGLSVLLSRRVQSSPDGRALVVTLVARYYLEHGDREQEECERLELGAVVERRVLLEECHPEAPHLAEKHRAERDLGERRQRGEEVGGGGATRPTPARVELVLLSLVANAGGDPDVNTHGATNDCRPADDRLLRDRGAFGDPPHRLLS